MIPGGTRKIYENCSCNIFTSEGQDVVHSCKISSCDTIFKASTAHFDDAVYVIYLFDRYSFLDLLDIPYDEGFIW